MSYMALLSLLVSCGSPEPVEDAGLSTAALASRISLDLRGVRPSPEELALVFANPGDLDGLVERWLADPRFARRIAWLWNDALHTAVYFDDYPRFGTLEATEWVALGEEPMRLVQAIVEQDRPLSELVTAEALYADETLAGLWDLERAGGDGWQPATHADGRPMAGLLSSTSLWNRYNADITNRNRMRANTVARVFLCADFFDRDVDFELDLDALSAVETAVHNEPACQSCHAALDPLAAFFGGFAERSQEEDLEQYRRYSPWTADWYAAWVPPAYYGHPGADLVDLGAMIAADPRFSTCAATRLYEGLLGATVDPDDLSLRAELGAVFRDQGLVTRDLARWIVEQPAYRADEERVLSSEQLQTALEDALGWSDASSVEAGLEPLSWSDDMRVLAGGTDDDTVLQRNRAPGLGTHAVALWAARRAVAPAIEADLARPAAERLLFTVAEPDGSWSESDTRRQLSWWIARFLGRVVAPDGEETDRLYDLWSRSGGQDQPRAAFTAALVALVRHPAMGIY